MTGGARALLRVAAGTGARHRSRTQAARGPSGRSEARFAEETVLLAHERPGGLVDLDEALALRELDARQSGSSSCASSPV
jgi:hypothetical protein